MSPKRSPNCIYVFAFDDVLNRWLTIMTFHTLVRHVFGYNVSSNILDFVVSLLQRTDHFGYDKLIVTDHCIDPSVLYVENKHVLYSFNALNFN